MFKNVCVILLIFLSALSFNTIAQEINSLTTKELNQRENISKSPKFDYSSFNIDEYLSNENISLLDFFISENNVEAGNKLNEFEKKNCEKNIFVPKVNNKNDKTPYVLLSETYDNIGLNGYSNKVTLFVPVPMDIKYKIYADNQINPIKNEISNKNNEDSYIQENNSIKSASLDLNNSSNRLYQNMPNPFINETKVGYDINSDVKNAVIKILSMQGHFIENIEIQDRGSGNIILTNKNLLPGNYVCVLILDGLVVSTIKMTLVKE